MTPDGGSDDGRASNVRNGRAEIRKDHAHQCRWDDGAADQPVVGNNPQPVETQNHSARLPKTRNQGFNGDDRTHFQPSAQYERGSRKALIPKTWKSKVGPAGAKQPKQIMGVRRRRWRCSTTDRRTNTKAGSANSQAEKKQQKSDGFIQPGVARRRE